MDIKISDLQSASTPLNGSEQFPAVQNGTTVKVAVSGVLFNAEETTKKYTNDINVDVLYPLGSGYYTLTTAISAIPSGNLRKIGSTVTFQSASGVFERWQYIGTSTSTWTTTTLWINTKENSSIRYAKNNTGATVAKGKLVYISGSTGENPLFLLATNTDYNIAAITWGMTYESINNNAVGRVINFGMIENIDTSAYAAGTELWLGVNGAFTNVRPTSPAFQTSIGMVIRQSATVGSIFINMRYVAIESVRSQNPNTSPSSKLVDDELKNTLDFRRMVFDGNAQLPAKVKDSVLNIELYNVDINKNYTIAVLSKNASSSHTWNIIIYDWVSNNFGSAIATWSENNHIPSSNIERLPLTLNSSIVGYATIDWTKLSDGDTFSSMVYSVAGLNNKIIDNKQIGINTNGINDNLTKIKKINNLAYFKNGYYYNTSGILSSHPGTKYTELIDISKYTNVIIYAESLGQASTVIFASDGTTVLGVILNNGLQTTINLANYPNYKYIAMSTGVNNSAWLYGEIKDYAELNYRVSNTEKNKTGNYPFILSANVPTPIKNAIKDIRLFDADPNKDYSITVINKKVPNSVESWNIKIYEIINGNFGNNCFWDKPIDYIPSANIEVIYLEPNGSNFSAQIVIDWSQLVDGYNVSALGLAYTGLMKEIIMNSHNIEISKNKFDIVLPDNIYIPTGNEYWFYDNSIILNDDLFSKDKYFLNATVDIRYGNKLSKITSSGTKTFKIQSKEKLDINYHSYVDLLTKSITVNTKTKVTGKTINTLMITDSYGDLQWGEGMMGYINSFATADGNNMSFKGTRTSYGYLGACIAGWTSTLFYSNYVPLANRVNVNSTNIDPSVMCSPFVFSDDDTKANAYFSYSKYLSENSINNVDNVVFFLGINGGTIDSINNMISNILTVNPSTNIFVCLINPSGTYGNLDLTTTSRQVVNLDYLKKFGNRENEHIYVIPTNASFDRVYGLRGSNQPTIQFDVDNIHDVKYVPYDHHPSANGCKQLAWMIYNYLLYFNS